MGVQCKLHHVKSHQDKSKKVSNLPLKVQLNVESDKLSEQRRLREISFSKSKLYPSTKTQFLIGKNTETKYIQQPIKVQYKEKEMVPC